MPKKQLRNRHVATFLRPVWLLAAAVLMTVATAAGCGSSSIPFGQVDGRVTMDGQPVQDVVVVFVPQANGAGAAARSFGQPDPAGRFQLKTDQGQAGAVVGEHVVILEDLGPYSAPRTEDGTLLKPYVPRFPATYSDPVRSPWKVSVAAGSQTIELEVKRP
ncbi:MAG: hypothetical protein U1A77_26070 [Pirellulales bacterium]